MVQTAQPDLFLGAGGGPEEAALAECQTWALMHQDDDDFNAPIPFGWRPPLTEMDQLINGGDFGAMSLEGGGGGGGGLAGDFFSPPEGLPDGPLGAAKKWPCLSHLYVKTILFCQDRLGTTIGKVLRKKLRFVQGRWDEGGGGGCAPRCVTKSSRSLR